MRRSRRSLTDSTRAREALARFAAPRGAAARRSRDERATVQPKDRAARPAPGDGHFQGRDVTQVRIAQAHVRGFGQLGASRVECRAQSVAHHRHLFRGLENHLESDVEDAVQAARRTRERAVLNQGRRTRSQCRASWDSCGWKKGTRGAPPQAMFEAMDTYIGEQAAKGATFLDGGGLFGDRGQRRTSSSARTVRPRAIDGPYAEAKEVVGGWALLAYDTLEEAIVGQQEFADLHRPSTGRGARWSTTLRQILDEAPPSESSSTPELYSRRERPGHPAMADPSSTQRGSLRWLGASRYDR